MLHSLAPLWPFTIAWLITVLVPGLNFVLVTRTAALHGRSAGLFTTLGIGIAAILWGLGGFLGLHALFEWQPSLETFAKIAGGLFLVWVGIDLIRKRNSELHAPTEQNETAGPETFRHSFLKGFFCCISNPDVLVFTTSLFATLFPAHAPLWMGLAATGIMFVIQVGWMGTLAYCLSAPFMAQWFNDKRNIIDIIAGTLFIILGGLLLYAPLKGLL
ncbi:LysE family translocator [Acetobacteraceae bacterium]|nr:LysE family translocator [Acetobacteraceae bacterium]